MTRMHTVLRRLSLIALAIAGLFAATAPSYAQGNQYVRYNYPRSGGYILDHCVTWGTNCGFAAAHAFCRRRGHVRAVSVQRYRPGSTRVHATRQICRGGQCVGFRSIRCLRRTAAGHRAGVSWHTQGRSWHARGRSWHQRGRSWHQRGRSWHQNGRSWHQGGRSWHQGGRSWHAQGRSWHVRNRSWHNRGRSWHSSGRSWHRQGRSWHRSGRSWHANGRSWHSNGRSWHRQGRSWHRQGRSWHASGRSWHRQGRSWHRQGRSWHNQGRSWHTQGRSWHRSGQSWGQKPPPPQGNKLGTPCTYRADDGQPRQGIWKRGAGAGNDVAIVCGPREQ